MSDEEWKDIADRLIEAVDTAPEGVKRQLASRAWQVRQMWICTCFICSLSIVLAGGIIFWLARMESRLQTGEVAREQILSRQFEVLRRLELLLKKSGIDQ